MTILITPSVNPQAAGGTRLRERAARFLTTLIVCATLGSAVIFGLDLTGTQYAFFAAYTVLQFVVLATAWNILGGYAGYVNFGAAGFFAVGVYTGVIVYKTVQWPLLITIPFAAFAAGLLGLGMGYLTLRLKGVFFSIATLALAVVLHTIVSNWSFVGGARGVYVLHPQSTEYFGSYARYLTIVMLLLAIGSVLIARFIERSWIGNGLAALKDDETAAEFAGVPSLRMKLFATTVSGAMLGAAGAPFPYFITYVDPGSAFNLTIAINAIAMPLIGGTSTWLGPVIGALLLGSLQQITTVTISSVFSQALVGILLIIFVSVAPSGIVGFVMDLREKRK